MPNAKRFLITSETKEVIVIRPAASDASEGKCPLCGSDVTNLPARVETTNLAALPPGPDATHEPIRNHDEEEKQK